MLLAKFCYTFFVISELGLKRPFSREFGRVAVRVRLESTACRYVLLFPGQAPRSSGRSGAPTGPQYISPSSCFWHQGKK